MTKRLLLVHRYFWPDVPTYARMLRFIGAHLSQEGHQVSVFSGPISYNGVYDGPPRPRSEVVEGIRVHRVALPSDSKSNPAVRATSLVVFAIRLIAHVVRHRSAYDLVTVTTIPPVVMGVAARIIQRLTGIPYLYHCMDLYPEVAVISGMARNRWLVRLAKQLDTRTCRNAAAVVVLSHDMRATLERRGLDCPNVTVLNNFEVLEENTADVESVIPSDARKFRVLFAGNIGRFQGLENLVTVAHRLAAEFPHVEFVFMGAGSSVPALKGQAGSLVGKTVQFVDHQPVEVAARAMEDCQLAVVSLRPRIHEVAYPSKTSMYLTAGCRLVAIVESDSDLAGLIHDEELGVTCPPGDVDTLTEVIRQEVGRGPLTPAQRERAQAIGEKHFGRSMRLADWAELIGQVGDRVG